MQKQSRKLLRRRPRAVVLSTVAAALALTGALGAAGVTPSSALESVFAPAKTAEATPATTAPSAGPAAEPRAEKAPKVSEAVGVAPAKPKADDEELGRTPQKKNKAVKMNEKVQVLDGMTIGITNLAAVSGVADEPGEVAGDAVKVSVTLTNTSPTAADTSGVVVDLEAGPNSIPGMALQGADTTTFPATIAPGESATADYVFVVESNQRARVSVLVNYAVTAPIAVFEGTAPPAKGKK
jgi:hypothetical protein